LLFGICLRYSKNRSDAEDILQDVFVKIYSKIGTFNHEGSFEGWLRRIAVNTSITFYKKSLKTAFHEDIDEVDVPDEQLGSDFTNEELMRCVQNLPLGYRTVFNLYVIEGMKHKEISEYLGIDVNTSKSQLSRSKAHLQKMLKELENVKNN